MAQVALPMVTVVGFLLVAVFSSGRGGGAAMFILPMFFAIIATAAFSWYMHKREEARLARQRAAYRERLLEMRREMTDQHELQRLFYHYNYPDNDTILRAAEDIHREPDRQEVSIRSGSRLWERRPDDEDFGFIRLGIGTLPSTTIYQFSSPENFDDDLTREAMRLDTDSRFVTDAPVAVALRPFPKKEETNESDANQKDDDIPPWPVPVSHATGIAGDPEDVHTFVHSLLAHFTAFHAPTDARLFIISPTRRPWEWAYSLPHCRPDEHTDYLCFEDEATSDDDAGDDESGGRTNRFLEDLRKVLTQRELRLRESDRAGGGDPRTPLLLLVVDLLTPARDGSPISTLDTDAAISMILGQGDGLGAAVIFLVPERSKVPSGCVAVVEIEATPAGGNGRPMPFFRYAEVGLNSWRYVGHADALSREAVTGFAQKLEGVDARKSYGGSLTAIVPFMEMMDESSMDSLRESSRHAWQRSLQEQSADWLRVRVGRMAGNKPRTLIFSAKRDGVHGMVAGSTGSGKSELLISMISGLALNYDPAMLNFVLVDYKGGGAFEDFRTLPHTVDIITNLAGAGVVRMFTAINAELKRRQALNVQTETKDIVEYHRRGYHQTREPYPFLFIIIDEFAEMIAESPEFKTELERITRVGRASGVHLVLAAQRPTGVTDQMRSNIKFRICLRVEGVDESREMLRRSDAAYLPSNIPGRGYIQIGNDNIEPIQVAYTGDRYIDPQRRRRVNVIWPGRARRAPVEGQDAPKVYQAIVQTLNKLAAAESIAEQKAPWPEYLPPDLTLTGEIKRDKLDGIDAITLGKEFGAALSLNPAVNRWLNHERGPGNELWPGVDWAKYALRPVVGLIDDPNQARRLPLVVNLPRGHVVMYGASGRGKTTFLRSLVVSLATTHKPSEVNIFILDLGGRNLRLLGDFPHVGAVIMPDEEGYEEQVRQLLRELSGLVEKRKKLLGDEGLDSIYDYNALHPAKALPAMVVLVDNFIEFKESFEGRAADDEGVLGEFIALSRESRAYGVHFVITIDNVGALPNKLYNVFTEQMTLKLNDPTEYRIVTGASVPDLEDIPGRGYIRVDRDALTFQVAQPVDVRRGAREALPGEGQEVRQLAAIMREEAGVADDSLSFLRVAPLPRTVSYRQMVNRSDGVAPAGNFISMLDGRARERWLESTLAERADWLTVNLGMASGNRPRLLKMAAAYDGVHGMIAGGTGSGKSELLMTMIVDLALNYDPSILNFVLVDYKGGGAFKPFERMPHVVDIITNLNISGVVRMFTAINAELKRRQKLNADTGTKDIIEYRSKGLHLDPQWGPYPHLIVIIDEYAEMITTMPEFKQELDSITRVGRASGVHLILAAQRPTGVTDQMRSNIKFRICLRVEGLDESREMLRRPDAALLPSGMPGRGYLQIGNEDIELIQVGYTGEKEPEGKDAAVLWPKRSARVVAPSAGTEVPRLFDRAVSLSNDILHAEGRPSAVRRPWPGFLPAAFTLQMAQDTEYMTDEDRARLRLGRSANDPMPRVPLNRWIADWQNGEGEWPGIDWKNHAMRPIVGLVDHPADARQLPFVLNLAQAHIAVYGDSGWGKTTLLRSTLTALVATHSPAELNFFILDLGGRNFKIFEPLPHVADIITPDDDDFEERVYRLVDRINAEIERRRRLFGAADAADLYDYNSRRPDAVEPALLVMIDNFAGLNETFESLVYGDLIPMVQNSRTYGIHFLVTANMPNAIPGKLSSLFSQQLALRLADVGQYLDIVGRGAVELDPVPGRGYVRLDRRPLEFQTAMPVGLPTDLNDTAREAALLREMIGNMDRQWTGVRPSSIVTLPRELSLTEVVEQAEAADRTPTVIRAVLGRRASLQPAEIDLQKDGPHFVVTGPPQSGKSTAMRNLVLSLARRYTPRQAPMILIDTRRKFFRYGGESGLDELPHVLAAVTDMEQLPPLIAQLKAEYARAVSEHKTEQIFIFIDNFDDFIEEISSSMGYDDSLSGDLAYLAHRYGTEGLHFIVAGSLDGASDLRRRVEANGYGFALRTEDALQKLSVSRIPGSLRGVELPLGRGYTAKSGRLVLIQAASPLFDSPLEPDDDRDGAMAAALDGWVDDIVARHPGDPAAWLTEPSEVVEPVAAVAGGFGPAPTRIERMVAAPSSDVIAILRRAVRSELARQKLDLPLETDRDVLDMAEGLFGGLPGDGEGDDDDDEDEEFELDMDFDTDDIRAAMESPEDGNP